MDAKLPWYKRLAVKLHLLYCVWCRRYAAQLQFLRRATKELAAAAADTESPRLSDEAKEHMRQRLQEALKSPPPSPQ
jgi:hypothetical protein